MNGGVAPGKHWRAGAPRLVGFALAAPALLILGLVFVYPILMLAWQAISQPTLGLTQFQRFFESEAAVRALLTTFRMSAMVTVVTIAIGWTVAWELRASQSLLKRIVLWSVVLFPLSTSIVVRNYAFTILLQREGVLNGSLMRLGLIERPLGILYTDVAVITGMVYTMLPFAIMPIFAALVNIDLDLVRAAESLGASRTRAVFSVVLPLALPSVLAAGTIVFVVSLGFYITPIVLGGPEAPFLATLIDQKIYRLFDLPGAAAAGTLLFVLAFAAVGLAWRAVGMERLKKAVQ